MCLCHCHQAGHNLVPAKGRWCSAAGKVTVGLASHWPCVTDFSGLSTYGLTATKREMSTPPMIQSGAWSTLSLYLCCRLLDWHSGGRKVMFVSCKQEVNWFRWYQDGNSVQVRPFLHQSATKRCMVFFIRLFPVITILYCLTYFCCVSCLKLNKVDRVPGYQHWFQAGLENGCICDKPRCFRFTEKCYSGSNYSFFCFLVQFYTDHIFVICVFCYNS